MRKKIIPKAFLPVLVFCVTVIGAYAAFQYLSNIYQHAMVVSEAQLMTISPDPSTPFPDKTITGQTFNISVNVENPNPIALKGRILLSFTTLGITTDSVTVTSEWHTPIGYGLHIYPSIAGDTLSFKIYPTSPADPYFTFQPGSNPGVVYFNVTYNTAGAYDVALAVVTT